MTATPAQPPDRDRAAHGPLIIEDAAYAYLVEHPPPPLAATAPDITVYVSGCPKASPPASASASSSPRRPSCLSLERAIRATTWNTPALTTAIACRWLEDGTVDHLEAQKRKMPRPVRPSPANHWRA